MWPNLTRHSLSVDGIDRLIDKPDTCVCLDLDNNSINFSFFAKNTTSYNYEQLNVTCSGLISSILLPSLCKRLLLLKKKKIVEIDFNVAGNVQIKKGLYKMSSATTGGPPIARISI